MSKLWATVIGATIGMVIVEILTKKWRDDQKERDRKAEEMTHQVFDTIDQDLQRIARERMKKAANL